MLRPSLLFALILVCSGCFQISKASRDSDDDEWGAKWGTDDAAGAKPPPHEQPEEKQPAKPAISEDDRNESFIALPPPSPMENRPQARPATPETMRPAPPPPPAKEPVKVAKEKPEKKRRKKKKLAPEEPPVEEAPPPEPKPLPAPVMYPEEAGKTKKVVPVPEKKPQLPLPPRRDLVVTPAASPTGPLFMIEVVGGVLMIPRGTRLQPGGGVGFGLNLGRLAGWQGLYLTADVDVLVGERQLLADTYLLIDGLVGVQGRIPVWKLKIVAGLGFGLRYMLLTEDSGQQEPELGFGAAAVTGVEVPITGRFSAVVLADGRYMKEPEFGSFKLTSMFSAGVVFSF